MGKLTLAGEDVPSKDEFKLAEIEASFPLGQQTKAVQTDHRNLSLADFPLLTQGQAMNKGQVFYLRGREASQEAVDTALIGELLLANHVGCLPVRP